MRAYFLLLYRYPVVGRLVAPPLCRAMAADELQPFNGTQPRTGGRVDPPLYVGCAGKVFDVSFGGFEMYKPGAGYHRCVAWGVRGANEPHHFLLPRA